MENYFDGLLVHISSSYIHIQTGNESSQLGLLYIAEYASHNNFCVKVVSFSSAMPIITELINLLQKYKFKVLGFYIDQENIWQIRQILPELKRLYPDIFVVGGGPQVTGNTSLVLKRIPLLDCVVIGEGEKTFVDLLSIDYKDVKKLSKVSGIAFIDNEKNIIFTKHRAPLKNIDLLPYPKRKLYSLNDNIEYKDMVTGRGCVGKCAFCFEGSKKHNKPRLRNIDSCIEEFDYLVSNLHESKYIVVADDSFILNIERVKKFATHIKNKYNGRIKWFCEARVDTLCKQIELLPLLKDSGLVRLQLGGESGSQKVLNAYNKGTTIEQLKFVIEMAYKANISSIYVNFIIGGAFETFETFNSTLSLAKEIMSLAPGCVESGASIYSPCAGSPMYENPEKYGLKILDKELVKGPDGYFAFCETDALTQYQIIQLKNTFNKEIENHYKSLLPYLSADQVLNHLRLAKDYKILTLWYSEICKYELYRNFFEPIIYNNFKTFDQLNSNEIDDAVPFRTTQPSSNGEDFYRINKYFEYIKNTMTDNIVILLSSGKLTFHDICKAIKFNDVMNGKTENEIRELLLKQFEMYDKEYSIIWKDCF